MSSSNNGSRAPEPRPQKPLVSLRTFAKKNGELEDALMFLDGPNFFYTSDRDIGCFMPFREVFQYFTKEQYCIAEAFAFHNEGCPWQIEKEFNQQGFVIVRCVSSQPPRRSQEDYWWDGGQCNRAPVSDAVDGGMIRFIEKMAQISNVRTFIIVSHDGAFKRVGNELLRQGIFAYWVRLQGNKQLMTIENFANDEVVEISNFRQNPEASKNQSPQQSQPAEPPVTAIVTAATPTLTTPLAALP